MAAKIVSAKLAACVQILPRMISVYFWEGNFQKESEYLLLIKTLPEKFNELKALITANHSYELPEIVAFEAEHVSKPYLEWVKEVMNFKG